MSLTKNSKYKWLIRQLIDQRRSGCCPPAGVQLELRLQATENVSTKNVLESLWVDTLTHTHKAPSRRNGLEAQRE